MFCFFAPSKPQQYRPQYYCSQSQINYPGCHQKLFKTLTKRMREMIQFLKKVPLAVYFYTDTERLILQINEDNKARSGWLS